MDDGLGGAVALVGDHDAGQMRVGLVKGDKRKAHDDHAVADLGKAAPAAPLMPITPLPGSPMMV